MEVKAIIKEGISKKNGNKFICVEITFPNGYKKVVFPQGAEKFIFEQCLGK